MKQIKLKELISEEIVKTTESTRSHDILSELRNSKRLEENVLKKVVDLVKSEYNKWKKTFQMAGQPRTAPYDRAAFVELFGMLIVVASMPVIGPILLGKSIYNKARTKVNQIQKNRNLSKEETQQELLTMADEIYKELPTGKQRYLKTLVNRVSGKGNVDVRDVEDLENYISKAVK